MALAGELMRYIGNEFVPMATKTAGSALSSVIPSAVAKAGTSLATKAGTATLNSLVPKMATSSASPDMITLYRGLTQKYDPKYPVAKLDTSGYESWTDNPELARQYGNHVYSIDVPKADIKEGYLDENPNSPTYGDRNPIYSIDKKAGLNGVSGREYLLEVGTPYQKNLNYNLVSSPSVKIPVQQDNYIPLYHQTSANSLADFSLDKRSAGVSDATMPEGIFLKETDADIGLPGKNQLQLDAKLNNPLKVINRDDLKAKLMAMNPKVAKYLRAETDLDNYYEKLSEEAQTAVDKAYEKMYYDKSDANKKAFAEATEKMKGIIPEWREKIRENATTSQKEIKKLLKDNGYDGMIMDEDRGSFGRKVKSYLVLDKEQLRDNSVPVRIKKYLDENILSDDDASILMQNYDANRANKLNGNDTSADELIVRNVAKKNGISEKTMGLLKNYSTLTNDRTYQKNKALLNKILTRENKDINALDKMSRKLLGAMGIEYENEMPVVYRAVTANEENSLSYTLDRKIAENLVKNDDTYKKVIRYVVKPNDIVIAPQFLGPLDTGGDLLHIIVKKA